jgi:hypothetical protein
MSAQEARKLPPPIPPEARKLPPPIPKKALAEGVRDNVRNITSATPKHLPRAYRKTAVGREYLKPVGQEGEDSEVKEAIKEMSAIPKGTNKESKKTEVQKAFGELFKMFEEQEKEKQKKAA